MQTEPNPGGLGTYNPFSTISQQTLTSPTEDTPPTSPYISPPSISSALPLSLAIDERQMGYLLVALLRHFPAPFLTLSFKPHSSLCQFVTSWHMLHPLKGEVYSRRGYIRTLCSSLVHPLHGRDGGAFTPRNPTPVDAPCGPRPPFPIPPPDDDEHARDRASLCYLPGPFSHGHGLHVYSYPRPRPEIP